jgi:hypothetical protein
MTLGAITSCFIRFLQFQNVVGNPLAILNTYEIPVTLLEAGDFGCPESGVRKIDDCSERLPAEWRSC